MVYSKHRRTPRTPRATAYEPFESDVISSLLKPGDITLDIGAHFGYYTLLFSLLTGPKGRVFAFEPDPTNFSILRKHVNSYQLNNVELEQKAVANKTTTLKLYRSTQNPGDHRIYDSIDGRQAIQVEAVALDDYFRNYTGRIDFIKMDIQGAEPGAIEGMSTLLQNNKSLYLATEFWPFGIKAFGVDPPQYLRTLLNYGFSLANINETTQRLEPVSDIDTLLHTCTPESNRYTNLLCTR